MRKKFTADNRLKKQFEFFTVKNNGIRKRYPCFIFQILIFNSPQEPNFNRRLGVVASKKTGNSVKRSRGKRIFREIFRNNLQELPKYCDLVIVVFSNFDQFTYEENEKYFLKCCKSIDNG